MNLQLIIPMSGIGKRFLDYGYSIPKPLIKVRGKEMVNHVVNMFDEIDRVLFICNENHLNSESLKLESILKKLHPNTKILSIKEHKRGPIHAVLEAERDIDLEMPTIINYCDFNSIFDFSKFKEVVKKENSDGIVFTYTGFHPHMLKNTNYAYIKKEDQRLIDIQEKKPFTETPMKEEVSSGTYFFKSGKIFKKFVPRLLSCSLKNIPKSFLFLNNSFLSFFDFNQSTILSNLHISIGVKYSTPSSSFCNFFIKFICFFINLQVFLGKIFTV